MPKPNFWRFKRSSRKQEAISKFFTPKNKSGNETCELGLGPASSSQQNNSGNSAAASLVIDDGDEIAETSKRPAENQDGSETKRQKMSSNHVPLAKTTVAKLYSFSFESPMVSDRTHNNSTSNESIAASKPQDLQRKLLSFKHEDKNTQSDAGSSTLTSNKFFEPKASSSNAPTKSSSQSSGTHRGKTAIKLTPLEQQFVAIKEKYQDAILFVECGYKFRFFGDDAEIAAKELNIFVHPDHNFMTASIPVHRLYVHVRRLVAKGYKVGVVKQTETAALKAAGDNRSGPFTRELSALYTKSTLIGEDVDSVNTTESSETSLGGHLMCIYEETNQDRHHFIALVSVQPTTGDIIYDYFEDNALREQLETRISHTQLAEILLPGSLSDKTEQLVRTLTATSITEEDRIRVQRLEDTDFSYDTVSKNLELFYQAGPGTSSSNNDRSDIRKLPKPVQSCFHALWMYLKDFGLQRLLSSSSELKQFSLAEHYLQLNGITQRNLELFYNLSDHKVRGSLLWVMDHCRTPSGRRLLRNWIARPLKEQRAINSRLDAVTELINPSESVLVKLVEILPTIPDIERGLAAVFHKKCSPMDFWRICNCLQKIHAILSFHKTSITSEVTSVLLQTNLLEMIDCLELAEQWTKSINVAAAKEGDKTKIFMSVDEFPAMKKCEEDIASVLNDIHLHRREVRLALKSPALEYVSIMGTEFLIEVKNKLVHLVPKDWLKINSTKAVSRFHSPFIMDSVKKLNQLKEQLILEANVAWLQFLERFEAEVYPFFKKGAHLLAEFDCLVSLSKVACLEGYSRPQLSEEDIQMSIKQGRHPVVEALISKQEQFVPNDTELSGEGERAMIITGPNMGGKSSYIKQVALISIMAHIGSYVPAEIATIPILNSIHTRMGASDDLFHGRSTFMVELQEAAQTLGAATKRSLVVLDELGRGTATHDGMAIAYATLQYLIAKVQCLTLFVTHYPLLAELESLHPSNVVNCHMAFLGSDEDGKEADDTVTFLYSLQHGVADRSFGLNVARLANIPAEVITTAARKSQELQTIIDQRLLQRKFCQDLLTAHENNIKELLEISNI